MMLAQSVIKKWIRNEWTPTHAVHEAATYKIWDINYNINRVLNTKSFTLYILDY